MFTVTIFSTCFFYLPCSLSRASKPPRSLIPKSSSIPENKNSSSPSSSPIKLQRGRQAGAGRKVTYGNELDLEILQWVLEMRDLQLPVTTDSLSAYAHKFVSEKIPELDFKASRGWAHKFMLRHNLSLR